MQSSAHSRNELSAFRLAAWIDYLDLLGKPTVSNPGLAFKS